MVKNIGWVQVSKRVIPWDSLSVNFTLYSVVHVWSFHILEDKNWKINLCMLYNRRPRLMRFYSEDYMSLSTSKGYRALQEEGFGWKNIENDQKLWNCPWNIIMIIDPYVSSNKRVTEERIIDCLFFFLIVSVSDRLLSVVLVNIYIFSRTTGPISTTPGTKLPSSWVKEIRVRLKFMHYSWCHFSVCIGQILMILSIKMSAFR